MTLREPNQLNSLKLVKGILDKHYIITNSPPPPKKKEIFIPSEVFHIKF